MCLKTLLIISALCGIIVGSSAQDERFLSLENPVQLNGQSNFAAETNFYSEQARSQHTFPGGPRASRLRRWRSFPNSNPRYNSSEARNGFSTRCWDCCKPSCSWHGKALVTNPVNSCAKDGFTVVDRNERNGCDGGNAYSCNNYIPWAINDDLAYGFASASISGQTESDWCCKCYELRFNSGPVDGKKMIVQVTNTGADYDEDNFCLQIPGGGVGIFGGCSSQWEASDGGWGDRYGGVHNIGECGQVPTQIRQGCKWRFEWFKGADNPSFEFNEVACPNELTLKTGCMRR